MLYTVGLIIGSLLAITGAGGAVFALPLLLLIGLPPATATANALLAVSIAALLATIAHSLRRAILWVPALSFAATGMLAAPLGRYLQSMLPPTLLLWAFAALALLIAYRLWQQALRAEPLDTLVPTQASGSGGVHCRFGAGGRLELRPRCLISLLTGGAIVGVLAGLFGIGGGFLLVPLLRWQLGVNMTVASGTAVASIAPISLAAALSYQLAAQPHDAPVFELAILQQLAIGGLLGVAAGTAVAHRLPQAFLQKLFALALVVLIAVLLAQSFDLGVEAHVHVAETTH